MDQDTSHMVAASKVSMLKPGEYEFWRMRMEQYIQMIDYSLWEVIEKIMGCRVVKSAAEAEPCIPIVKVRWNSKRGPEFTWEREDQMQKKYPYLFSNSAPVADATS
ncbi:putative reverse transcriptase domain-containing protein [Tanacetum coccineum]|uniref:Reverse transcriptase domain-containing protein n=1 Tax=Tanacetum coccineum TaxID=301880 RepID=A0ABQ5A0T5_9ASTR